MRVSDNIYIVSNRMPVTVSNLQGKPVVKKSSGGLVAALTPVHSMAKSWWVGYLGENISDSKEIQDYLEKERYIPVSIPKDLYQDYYNGASNGSIWPLFHYFPSMAEFLPEQWDAYKKVNEIFCDVIVEKVKDGDFIWVQDYQLMLLPEMIRKKRPGVHIGYFHHIPWPASDVFRILPWRQEILRGLLGADVVGFHTLEYTRHFVSSVSRLIGCENNGENIYCGERIVKVGAFPLGIDIKSLEEATQTEAHHAKLAELTQSFAGKTLILGVDRLDYTKGIKERIQAYEAFLKKNADYRTSVVFLQLCVPSRTDVLWYSNLRQEIERLVGNINGQFGSTTHTPLQYLFQSVTLPELTALYRRADVCLITPRRDGLNLVCKEYVETRADLEGVLILSEFAGAAEEMGEAILVNPYDISETANAIETAIKMPLEEKRARMKTLRERVHDYNNQSWAASFMEILYESVERNQSNFSREIEEKEFRNICERVKESPKTFLCFDYDGTLVSFTRRFDYSSSFGKSLEIIESLATQKDLVVALVTRHTKSFCDQNFASVPFWLLAENGAFIRMPESSEWNLTTNADAFESHRAEVMRILERCVRRVPRSRIDVNETAVIWDYRRTNSIFAHNLALETAHSLNLMLGKSVYHCVLGRGMLEVRSHQINKGTAIEKLLAMNNSSPQDLVITVGDNKTDEEMFRLSPDNNISISIGPPSFFSQFTLRGHPETRKMLADLLSFYVGNENRDFDWRSHET